jgi:deoxyribonuclease-2
MDRAVLAGLFAHICIDSGLNCLDNDGKAVSWAFTYKFPSGFDIAYFDAGDRGSGSSYLKKFERSLDDTSNPVSLIRTLRQLASSHEESEVQPILNASESAAGIQFLLYNDQPDNAQPSSSYGHAKGVLAMSGSDAIWIVHSTPHFPSASGSKKFYFPSTETKYGQTYLCFQLPSSEVDKVANQLLYTRPYIYKNTFTSSATSTYPNLKKVFDGEWITDGGSNMVTLGRFRSFAKNAAWNDDLYESAIATYYKSDLYVESWLRGSKEGSYCKPKYKYEVLDVKTMVAKGPDGNITWTEGADHAKWAVMLDGSSNLCVGDINRMTTQRDRGGGAVCFSDVDLSNVLYNSIDTGFLCKK